MDIRNTYLYIVCMVAVFSPNHTFFLFINANSTPIQSNENSEPLVQIKDGLIRGFTMLSDKGREFYAFQRIPYAKPPIKELRFKPPVPNDPWNRTLDATKEGDFCVQIGFFPILRGIMGNEDCLFLNVYTPKLPNRSDHTLKPVLVLIPGGAFIEMAGSTFYHGPRRFMDNDLVMVVFNYRLGALGFLSTGDEASPGNYGLLDQLLVLKWVKANIRHFGGNPDSVTLMGVSAGAMSVSAHMVSPLSKGLFHKAILHSGVIMAPKMLNMKPLEMAAALADKVNCRSSTTEELVKCLAGKDAETLIMKGNRLSIPYTVAILPHFVPVVDGIFLLEHPYLLYKRGEFHRIPILTGVNRDEGMLFYELEKILNNAHNEKAFFEKKFFEIINSFCDSVDEALKNFPLFLREYFENNDYHCLKTARRKFSQVISDVFFNAPVINFLKLISSFIRTYVYVFEFRGEFQLPDLIPMKDKDIVTHGDEVFFLFDSFFSIIKRNLEDAKLSEKLLSLWTNFIFYGNPSPNGQPVQWDPATSDSLKYLHITKNLTMKTDYRSQKVQFINNIFTSMKERIRKTNISYEDLLIPSDKIRFPFGSQECVETR